MREFTIDVDAIAEIAKLGVRRSAAFLGLGMNATNDDSFINYELTNLSSIQIIPSNINEDSIKNFKTEFGIWITQCGLRELIESFSVFLDKTFETA